MGRTFEALTQSRFKRAVAEEEESIPPTAAIPAFSTAVAPPLDASVDSDVEDGQATADTALLDEFSHDNEGVPYIEVGGPKGSPPTYGPLVAPTPAQVPDPAPLEHAPPAVEHQSPPVASIGGGGPQAVPAWSVSFFPVPDFQPGESARIAPELVAFHRADHPVSAQYRALLAGMSVQQAATGCPLLVFTTVGHNLDAATVLLNVAITRAREEAKRVLVIEANHDRPLIADRLGVASLPGLRELLNRSVPLSVALRPTAQANLMALPPGDPDLPVSNEAEARLPAVVDQLRRRFDWVFVNGPEWGSGGAAEWAGLGDAVYLVVRHDQWDTPEVEAAHQALVQSGGKLRGYVTIHDTPRAGDDGEARGTRKRPPRNSRRDS